MRLMTVVLLGTLVATPATAQERPGMGGRGPQQRLPERWIPLDSLVTALSLTPEQRAQLEPLHAELDSLMQRGAALRRQAREEMMNDPSRERMRALRDQLDFLQQDADKRHTAIRKLLTAEQHAAFDSLRSPRVMPRRRRLDRRTG